MPLAIPIHVAAISNFVKLSQIVIPAERTKLMFQLLFVVVEGLTHSGDDQTE